MYQFDYTGDPENVVIDDASTVAALEAITTKYPDKGKTVTILNLNDDCAK